jgi:preprotein translocase subunit SecY
MLKTLQSAWKVGDLRNKILITLALLAVYRFGIFIPVPGVNVAVVKQMVEGGMFLGFLDIMSGGGYKDFSIFAMGIVPYINSSIIMSLLTIAIPKLETLSKEGEEGRKKIAEYTRYGTIIFALIQGVSMGIALRNKNALYSNSILSIVIIVITLTAGAAFVMWLGEKITEFGIGNGSSLIIFAGILARLPNYIWQVITLMQAQTVNIIQVLLLLVFLFALIVGVVIMDLGERRIPVQYAQRRVGMKTYGGQSTHIPININSTGVIAIIFAISVMQFPQLITQFSNKTTSKLYILFNSGVLSSKGWLYPIIYVALILFFTWFYTSVTFKPDEVAENLQKNGGFIPGLRPGKPTEEYITRVMNRMTLIGGCFASIIAVVPIIVQNYTKFSNLYLGGTALLIIVGVAMEVNKRLQAQLVMRHYEGFLK